MLERTADLVKKCREWYAALRISPRLPRHPRFLRRRSQRLLLRRAERSPVHQSAAQQIAPLRANRRLENHQRAGPPHRADPRLHRRRNLEISAEGARRTRKRPHDRVPRRAMLCAPSFPPNKVAIWELLAKVRAEVLKALEAARNEKKINSGLEAKVLLERRARAESQAQAIPAGSCRASSSFLRSISLTAGARRLPLRRDPRPGSHRAKGRRQEMRALLELLHARRRKSALSDDLRALHRSARRNRRRTSAAQSRLTHAMITMRPATHARRQENPVDHPWTPALAVAHARRGLARPRQQSLVRNANRRRLALTS